jgi:hypothetical protein
MTSHDEKIIELEKRLERLEQEVFGQDKATANPLLAAQSPPRLEDLKIPNDVLSGLQARIRKVGYLDLILILLYFSSRSLTYSDMMSLSKELKKPVHYEWLNTHFHRKKYSGLVSSKPIANSPERTYNLYEPGRRRAEAVMAKLKPLRS